MIFIGIDLHSNKFTCCFIYENNRRKTITFPLNAQGINDFLKTVDKEIYIMVEASSNTFWFVERIKCHVKEVIIANTHKLKLISLVKKKTDKIDAEKLAIVLKMQIKSKEKMFEPVHLPNDVIQKLRSLFTTYRLYRKYITSMKGISIMTAIALIADISVLSRFKNSKKLASYLRSAPGVDGSNDEIKNLSTNKKGRKMSITLLSQSLNHFRDSNIKIKRWYEKKTANNKKRGKIRMAICRRVFTEIYQMIKKKEYHYFMDEQNHLKKMEVYITLLKNYQVPEKYSYNFKKSV